MRISNGMHLKIFSSAMCTVMYPYIKDNHATYLIYPYLVLTNRILSVLSVYSFYCWKW